MGVTAGIFLASILLKEMRYLVYIRYLWCDHAITKTLAAPKKLKRAAGCIQGNSSTYR
jgi:hypothetical protein